MKLPYDVNRVSNLLSLHGVPVESVTDGDCELEDGCIVINDAIHVQVGEYYLHIVIEVRPEVYKWDREMYDYRPGQLVNRLKQLLNEPHHTKRGPSSASGGAQSTKEG